MIVLGDAGLNYYTGWKDETRKHFVNSFPFTTFCIHGNHEMRPMDIQTYKTKDFCGGIVWYEANTQRSFLQRTEKFIILTGIPAS